MGVPFLFIGRYVRANAVFSTFDVEPWREGPGVLKLVVSRLIGED